MSQSRWMECSAGKFLMLTVIAPFVCGSDDGVQTSIPFYKTETRIAFQERRAASRVPLSLGANTNIIACFSLCPELYISE